MAVVLTSDCTTLASCDVVWKNWTCSSTTTCTTSDTVWVSWIGDCTATTDLTASGTASAIWTSWIADSTHTPYVRGVRSVPQLTPEQVAENQRIAQEREQRKEAIRKRSEAILLDNLDNEQKESFKRNRQFEVISPTSRRRYLVASGTVYELDKNGRRLRSFCIHPREAYPEYDNMLAKKLMLEAEEQEFLRIANVTRLAS